MRKFIFISLLLLLSAPVFSAQQTLNNLETFGVQRAKINENFTELYSWGNHGLVGYLTSGHTVASDPHAGYMLESNIGTGANNYVQLDGTGKLPAIDGSQLTNLPGGGTDDQTATEVPFTPYLTIGSTNTQLAIEELKDEVDAGGGTDDQTAAEVPFTPNGSIAATDTQSAVQEVRDESQPADADLDIYAGITPSANVQSVLSAANNAAIKTLLGYLTSADTSGWDQNAADDFDGAYGSLTGVPATFAPSSHGDSAHSETYLKPADVEDTPENGSGDPISSNWAFDHGAAADPHPDYALEANLPTFTFGDLVAMGVTVGFRSDSAVCDSENGGHAAALATVATYGFDEENIICNLGLPTDPDNPTVTLVGVTATGFVGSLSVSDGGSVVNETITITGVSATGSVGALGVSPIVEAFNGTNGVTIASPLFTTVTAGAGTATYDGSGNGVIYCSHAVSTDASFLYRAITRAVTKSYMTTFQFNSETLASAAYPIQLLQSSSTPAATTGSFLGTNATVYARVRNDGADNYFMDLYYYDNTDTLQRWDAPTDGFVSAGNTSASISADTTYKIKIETTATQWRFTLLSAADSVLEQGGWINWSATRDTSDSQYLIVGRNIIDSTAYFTLTVDQYTEDQ